MIAVNKKIILSFMGVVNSNMARSTAHVIVGCSSEFCDVLILFLNYNTAIHEYIITLYIVLLAIVSCAKKKSFAFQNTTQILIKMYLKYI